MSVTGGTKTCPRPIHGTPEVKGSLSFLETLSQFPKALFTMGPSFDHVQTSYILGNMS